MVFTEACAKRTDFLQRIFLPQHLEDYLHAGDTDGTRDFQEGEEQRARRLLTGSQIIEESVVARSADRDERFEEVNLEIARSSDLVICLTRKLSDAERKKKEENANNGGTGDLLNRALARGLTTWNWRSRWSKTDKLFVRSGNGTIRELSAAGASGRLALCENRKWYTTGGCFLESDGTTERWRG
ncbi:MAG: hypothetical protein IPH05_05465 [Flavobacteriales bacterium]|nr:hypothetical protein [Flavobacteriales bacterium]